MQQIITVRAIIKEDQKILFLRRSGGNPHFEGLFELPGGKVDFGEDPKATLQREVLEETGSEISAMQLADVLSHQDLRDAEKQYVILTFMVALKQQSKITLSSEHDKYTWKQLSDLQLNQVTELTQIALQIEPIAKVIDVEKSIVKKKDVDYATYNADVLVYADGGSRGNPGPSASGFVIKDKEERLLFEGGKYLGITTNNQAEYQAVKLALEKLVEMDVKTAQFKLDSLLVVNQLNGIYKIRNRDLWPIYSYIKEMAQKFKEISFTHIRREFNKEADSMVNKILDEHS